MPSHNERPRTTFPDTRSRSPRLPSFVFAVLVTQLVFAIFTCPAQAQWKRPLYSLAGTLSRKLVPREYPSNLPSSTPSSQPLPPIVRGRPPWASDEYGETTRALEAVQEANYFASQPESIDPPEPTQEANEEVDRALGVPGRFRPISQLTATVPRNSGEMPDDLAESHFAEHGSEAHTMGYSRYDMATEFNWEAVALCHRPLYFEEVNVERHGYRVKYLQPLISGAHFFSRVPAMPYLALSENHQECTYTLGHYRPGSCAPYVWYRPRFSLDGAAFQAGVITGLMYAIP